MATGQNVCFGCNSVPDVKICDKKDCFAHGYRNETLKLDDEYNKAVNLKKHNMEKYMFVR